MISETPSEKTEKPTPRMEIYREQKKNAIGLFWAKTITTILLAPGVVYSISRDLELTFIVVLICALGSLLNYIQLYLASEAELQAVVKADV